MQVHFGGRTCMKTEYHFRAPSVPDNYFEVQMNLTLCASLVKHSGAC